MEKIKLFKPFIKKQDYKSSVILMSSIDENCSPKGTKFRGTDCKTGCKNTGCNK